MTSFMEYEKDETHDEEYEHFVDEVLEKIAVAEKSIKAGRVMDGFESLKIIRAKYDL